MQFGFFAVMSGVGGAAWYCPQASLGGGMLSAITLMAMVLTVVVDFRWLGDSAFSANAAGRG
jgi:hypothetical protein